MKKIRFLEWTIKICHSLRCWVQARICWDVVVVVVLIVGTSGSSSSGYNVNIEGPTTQQSQGHGDGGASVNVNSMGGVGLTAGFRVPSVVDGRPLYHPPTRQVPVCAVWCPLSRQTVCK